MRLAILGRRGRKEEGREGGREGGEREIENFSSPPSQEGEGAVGREHKQSEFLILEWQPPDLRRHRASEVAKCIRRFGLNCASNCR